MVTWYVKCELVGKKKCNLVGKKTQFGWQKNYPKVGGAAGADDPPQMSPGWNPELFVLIWDMSISSNVFCGWILVIWNGNCWEFFKCD